MQTAVDQGAPEIATEPAFVEGFGAEPGTGGIRFDCGEAVVGVVSARGERRGGRTDMEPAAELT